MRAMALPTLCRTQTRTAKPSPTGINHDRLEVMSAHLPVGGEVERESTGAASALGLAGQQSSEPPALGAAGPVAGVACLLGDGPCAVTGCVFYACHCSPLVRWTAQKRSRLVARVPLLRLWTCCGTTRACGIATRPSVCICLK